MPMGTTSYLFLSMASSTDAAESSETSCSPLRPPNRIPTRVFFIAFHHKTRSATTHIYEFGGGLCPFCLGPLSLLGEGAVEGELFLHQAREICRVLLAFGFGNLRLQRALPALQALAAKRVKGAFGKLRGELFLGLAHENRSQQAAVAFVQLQIHRISGAVGAE